VGRGCHPSVVHSWQFCVSSVYFWLGKGDKYGEGFPSICSVQLSKMWVGCGGTVCSLVITFCVSCAENDCVVLMIAEGNGSHVSFVLPI
jgi:hypothetical protein